MGFKEFNKDKIANKGKSNKRFSRGSSRGKFRGNSRDKPRDKFSDSRSKFRSSSRDKPRDKFSDGESKFRSNSKPRYNDKNKFSSQRRSTPSKKGGFSRKKEFELPKHDKEQFIPIKFSNTYLHIKKRGLDLFTKNLTPGKTFFDEITITKKFDNKQVELRHWDYTRSKLGAAIALKISQLGLFEDSKVLYLGASHGFTPSFVSDIVGSKGFVFCLDFAPRVVRDLYLLCQYRTNMAPIIADANQPEEYEHLIPEVDVIFMDIAQRNQVEIFLKNIKFLKKNGFALLALKARSIDVTKKPKHIFKEARAELEKHITIVDYKELDPYEKDHCFFVCKRK